MYYIFYINSYEKVKKKDVSEKWNILLLNIFEEYSY